FLEATFLGVMLFGWKRVPPWLHVFSAIAVAVGTAISAFWILSANSWLQTPAGHEVRGGIAYPVDWLAVIFNPSFIYRLAHMLTAAYLTTSLVVLAGGARYLLSPRPPPEERTPIRPAVGTLAALRPFPLLLGGQAGPQYVAPPADQDRSHRGALGWHQAGRPRAVRLAGRKNGNEPLRGRNPQGRIADSHP